MKFISDKRDLLLYLILSLPLCAWSQDHSWTNPPPILTKSDTVIMGYDSDDGAYVYHTVKKYQSIYRLVNFYQANMDTTLEWNNLRPGRPLQIGSELRIPMNPENVTTSFFGRSIFKNYNKVYVRMAKDQSIYSLSRAFDVGVGTVERRNDLKAENLPPNSILRIGWFPREGLYDPKTTAEMEKDGLDREKLEGEFEAGIEKGTYKEDRGVAFWNKNATEESGFFALHKYAEVGSYIEVTNPMFGTKVFAKVVGRIPDNSYPEEILTILSYEAAEELRAKDARFFVKIRYLQSNSTTGKF
jgi:LysM repeat protein